MKRLNYLLILLLGFTSVCCDPVNVDMYGPMPPSENEEMGMFHPSDRVDVNMDAVQQESADSSNNPKCEL